MRREYRYPQVVSQHLNPCDYANLVKNARKIPIGCQSDLRVYRQLNISPPQIYYQGAVNGYLDLVKYAISKNPNLINDVNVLLQAINEEQVNTVSFILDRIGPVNFDGLFINTLSRPYIFQNLWARVPDKRGYLDGFAENIDIQEVNIPFPVIKKLLRWGLPVNKIFQSDVFRTGDLPLIRYLLNYRGSIPINPKWIEKILKSQNLGAVRYLLDHNLINRNQVDPTVHVLPEVLDGDLQSETIDALKLLDSYGYPFTVDAIRTALRLNLNQVIDYFWQKNPNRVRRIANEFLIFAVQNGRIELIQQLVSLGAITESNSALIEAVSRRELDMVQLLAPFADPIRLRKIDLLRIIRRQIPANQQTLDMARAILDIPGPIDLSELNSVIQSTYPGKYKTFLRGYRRNLLHGGYDLNADILSFDPEVQPLLYTLVQKIAGLNLSQLQKIEFSNDPVISDPTDWIQRAFDLIDEQYEAVQRRDDTIYLRYRQLSRSSNDLIRMSLPQFPYGRETHPSRYMVVGNLGSGDFDLALTDYLNAIPNPDTRLAVQNLVLEHFRNYPGVLGFIQLYNYLITLR